MQLMKSFLIAFFTFFVLFNASAQSPATFKCGWNTYHTATVIHEFTYSYVYKDSFKLYLADSTKTFIAPDSQVVLNIDYPFHDNIVYKVANYYNAKRKVIKTEEYKDNSVQVLRDFKYDDKNRKIYSYEDNKLTLNNYKKLYDYSTEKGTGDIVITETSYFNGALEFYTKSYFDKNSSKYKEVRLNNNNKDIVHVEKFFYNAAGKLKSRSVFFPEFQVTKEFPEAGGDDPVKCYKSMAMNISDKATLQTKVSFLKKLLMKNQALLLDKDCHDFEYKFTSSDCEVVISTTKTNNIKQVIFRLKEKVSK